MSEHRFFSSTWSSGLSFVYRFSYRYRSQNKAVVNIESIFRKTHKKSNTATRIACRKYVHTHTVLYNSLTKRIEGVGEAVHLLFMQSAKL